MAKSNGKTKLKADRKKEDDSTSRRKALDIKESKRKKDKNKKKCHDVVASDVGFPLGPTDRIGVLRCVEGQLEAAPSVWMDNLSDKFCNGGGLAMTSDYSGIGQPELAMRRIRDYLRDHRCQDGRGAPQLTLQRASEILAIARETLIEAGTDDECVFGDMTKRMPAELLEKITLLRDKCREMQKQAMDAVVADTDALMEAKHAAESKYLSGVKELILAEKTYINKQLSWCYKHNRMCPSNPPASDDQISMSVAGVSCIDWSVRGKKLGSLGVGCLSWTCYMREVIHCQYDIVVLECTCGYQEKDAIFMLGHLYVFEGCIFSPTEIGVPSERWRKYMVFIHRRGKVQWIPGQELSRENLLQTFGRMLACDGHVYMDHTPDYMIQKQIVALAARLGMPARDENGRPWKARSVMTRLSRARLESYEELLNKKGQSGVASAYLRRRVAEGGLWPHERVRARAHAEEPHLVHVLRQAHAQRGKDRSHGHPMHSQRGDFRFGSSVATSLEEVLRMQCQSTHWELYAARRHFCRADLHLGLHRAALVSRLGDRGLDA